MSIIIFEALGMVVKKRDGFASHGQEKVVRVRISYNRIKKNQVKTKTIELMSTSLLHQYVSVYVTGRAI